MSRDFIGSAPGRSFKKSPNRDRVTLASVLLSGMIRYLSNRNGYISEDAKLYTKLRAKLVFNNVEVPSNSFTREQLFDFGSVYYNGLSQVPIPVPEMVSESGKQTWIDDASFFNFYKFSNGEVVVNDDLYRKLYRRVVNPPPINTVSYEMTLELWWEDPVEFEGYFSELNSPFAADNRFPGQTAPGELNYPRQKTLFVGYDTRGGSNHDETIQVRIPDNGFLLPNQSIMETAEVHVSANTGRLFGFPARSIRICAVVDQEIPSVGFVLQKTSLGLSQAHRALAHVKFPVYMELLCEQNKAIPGGVLSISQTEAVGYFVARAKFNDGRLAAYVSGGGVQAIENMRLYESMNISPSCFV